MWVAESKQRSRQRGGRGEIFVYFPGFALKATDLAEPSLGHVGIYITGRFAASL